MSALILLKNVPDFKDLNIKINFIKTYKIKVIKINRIRTML